MGATKECGLKEGYEGEKREEREERKKRGKDDEQTRKMCVHKTHDRPAGKEKKRSPIVITVCRVNDVEMEKRREEGEEKKEKEKAIFLELTVRATEVHHIDDDSASRPVLWRRAGATPLGVQRGLTPNILKVFGIGSSECKMLRGRQHLLTLLAETGHINIHLKSKDVGSMGRTIHARSQTLHAVRFYIFTWQIEKKHREGDAQTR